MTSTPPPSFTGAVPLNSPNYFSMQISGTSQGEGIGLVLEEAVNNDVIANGKTTINKQNGQLFWQISITDPSGKTTYATTGDWIVIGTDATGAIETIKLYNGTGPYNNPPYTGAFT